MFTKFMCIQQAVKTSAVYITRLSVLLQPAWLLAASVIGALNFTDWRGWNEMEEIPLAAIVATSTKNLRTVLNSRYGTI